MTHTQQQEVTSKGITKIDIKAHMIASVNTAATIDEPRSQKRATCGSALRKKQKHKERNRDQKPRETQR